MSPKEFAEEFAAAVDVSLGVVSYHFRRLHSLGYIDLAKRTPRRGAIEHHYRIAEQVPTSNASAQANHQAIRRARIAAGAQALAREATIANTVRSFEHPLASLHQRLMQLDPIGRAHLDAATRRCVARARDISAESSARLRQDPTGSHRVVLGLLLFECQAEPPGPEPTWSRPQRRHEGHR